MKKERKEIILFILLVICVFTFTYSLTKIIMWNDDNNENQAIVDNLQKETKVNEIPSIDALTTIIGEDEVAKKDKNKTSVYWKYIKMNMLDVDLKSLIKKNKDTKGWIKVNGTNINYPFVQTKDNSYYLTHSIEKKYTDAGWIFLDYRNNINKLSKNNIIYGHARLNKTMFGTLKNVLTEDWYKNEDNHIIKLSTDKENTLWQIFSVYNIKTESYYITTDFANDKEYQEFIDTMVKRSKHKFDAVVTTNDTLLTLSTCYKTNEKIVVHAKLIKKEAKSE